MSFFAARQAILNKNGELKGYELLFRLGLDNAFPNVDEEKATSKMIEGLQLDLGLDRVASGKLAFVNFTHQSIIGGYPLLLPPEKVAIEILETAKPTKQLYSQLNSLASKGYTLVMDDFVHDDAWTPFYPLLKIIKVDFKNTSKEQIVETVGLYKKFPHIQMLAEKIETAEEFKEANDLGFSLFQGYFFTKPEIIKSVTLNSSQSTLTSLLREANEKEPSINNITKILESDVALSFKLLRYTQSAMFKRRKAIESIRQAVVSLGITELKKFIVLLFAAQFSEGKPTELVRLSMHRARFCEVLALATNKVGDQSSAFLAGMLSLIDAMLDADLSVVISDLPICDDIKSALLEKEGWIAQFLAVCEDFERANWSRVEQGCLALGVDLNSVLMDYEQAMIWSEEQLKLIV